MKGKRRKSQYFSQDYANATATAIFVSV